MIKLQSTVRFINDGFGLGPVVRCARREGRLRAVRVACKNFVDRNLTLSVCDHSSIALNHITNSVKSASFSKCIRSHLGWLPAANAQSSTKRGLFGRNRKFAAALTNDRYRIVGSRCAVGRDDLPRTIPAVRRGNCSFYEPRRC